MRHLAQEIYRDKAGKKRHVTALQEKILMFLLLNPGRPLSDVARQLKCSYTAVIQTTTNPICEARRQEIRDMVDKAKVMQLQEMQEELTVMARTDITDIVDSAGGISVVKDNPASGAVQEFAVRPGKFGEQRRVKLYSKLDAMELLMRSQGMLKAEGNTINLAAIKIIVERAPTPVIEIEQVTG